MSCQKVFLVVFDGWGISDRQSHEFYKTDGKIDLDTEKYNAIVNSHTPLMDKLFDPNRCNCTMLRAHGEYVGLPGGFVGNSEVGHLNIGAGRVVDQDVVRIDKAINEGTFFKQKNLRKALEHAKTNGRIHFIGLVSDGGVHSRNTHLYELLKSAKHFGLQEAFVHFISDGRDTKQKSISKYLLELHQLMEKENYGILSTIVGRRYVMDRNDRWDWIKMAYDAYTKSTGHNIRSAALNDILEKIQMEYRKGVTDELLEPIIVEKAGCIRDGDTVVFFNFRNDRMRQIVRSFCDESVFHDPERPKNLMIASLTEYSTSFPVTAIFPPEYIENGLSEWLSKRNIKQCHLAETEKYAHVTFFFNGRREKPFDGEDRVLIPSPDVDSYDMIPEMSCMPLTEECCRRVESGNYEFIMCNIASPDMVGHTGNYEATLKAVEYADKALGVIHESCLKHGYTLVVTADHGNAEKMMHEDGSPYTAHTTSPVPFLVSDKNIKLSTGKNFALCDIAPTILDIMGISKPKEMTGTSMLVNKQ